MRKNLEPKDITAFFKKNPIGKSNGKEEIANIKKFTKFLDQHSECKAVLGIDIYRYSQYPGLPQTLIPFLFYRIYYSTIEHCVQYEPTIFKNITQKELGENFINTGDGGFQIFDNPLQAIIFLIYFQANISRYNSQNESTLDEFKIIDEITLRYALTYDNIYYFHNNYYGPAIINCARIISKDKLNRFLVDERTKKWFLKEINGIENLQFIDIIKDYKISIFNNVKKSEDIKSIIFLKDECKIKHVDLMKIGEIKSKLDILSIYNLRVQVLMISGNSNFKKHAISIGNSNSSGLVE